MKQIRLLDLGTVSALRSQTVFHAAAYAMAEDTPNTIILVSPNQPYVCIGYHQDLVKEVELAYCQANGLPVYRREIGGGAVYLDNGQIFTQWIFHKDHLPIRLEQQFSLYIQPLIETYHALGIKAHFRPINDVHVDGKKIGGTGAAQIGLAQVLAGSLMLTFDKATMAQVLKVSSEKIRDKIFESLGQYMTTVSEQLDPMPDRQTIKDLYIQKCAEILEAEIVPGKWTSEEETTAIKLDRRFTSKEWLFQKSGLRQAHVKIHEDVRVTETAFKSPGGLIRVTVRLHEGRIDDLTLSGDFALLPSCAVSSLEQAARGLSISCNLLLTRLQEVYRSEGIQSPGVTPEHFTEAILSAVSG